MNKICDDYCKLINQKFSKYIRSIIFYGSNIYDVSNSDLDVCLISKELTPEIQQEIISETIKFHINNNLRIDEEVPHKNKLIFTVDEIIETLTNPPFFVNGEIIIHDIDKNPVFLSSKEMKQRLLLNILTTDHRTIGESTAEYETQALKIILFVIRSYFKIENASIDEILECMYQNKYTGASGEMYLGYKKNHKEKDEYLRRKIKEALK